MAKLIFNKLLLLSEIINGEMSKYFMNLNQFDRNYKHLTKSIE